jgi:tRNA(Ile)-lysidine synthase
MASTRNSRLPADLVGRVSCRLEALVRRDDRLVAALSGGVDSVVLLHVLRALSSRLGFSLSALHVNHGLSPNADRWERFCRELCGSLGIPCSVKRVVVQPGGKVSLEEAARKARYAAFSAIDAEWLALAHQRNDQAETLLFNLLRGAGLAGAAAMPGVRPFPSRAGLCILRPLLDCAREDIAQYAGSQGLEWVEDESNRDTHHARNFLRRQVFPLLRERFPGCDAVLARSAGHFAESEALLDQLAEIDARYALRDGRVTVAALAGMGEARARNLLRHVLKREGIAMPDSARLREAVRQLCHAAPDRQVRIDLGERVLHRYRGEVWLRMPEVRTEPVEWRGEGDLAWGHGSVRFAECEGCGLSRERLEGRSIRAVPRRGGERFQPDAGRPRRELKKLLQEHGVPPWQREAMPLLWCAGNLVWVPGIGIDCAWQCRTGEAGIMPKWVPG